MMKTGDIVTMMHDCITHGGEIIHESNDKVTTWCRYRASTLFKTMP